MHKPHLHLPSAAAQHVCPPCRYDRGTLSPLLTSVNSYSSVRRQPLPALTGLLGSLLLTGNPQGTAQSLAKAYNGGDSEAAAQAVASAAAGSGAAQANTVAQAISETATSHPNVAPGAATCLDSPMGCYFAIGRACNTSRVCPISH